MKTGMVKRKIFTLSNSKAAIQNRKRKKILTMPQRYWPSFHVGQAVTDGKGWYTSAPGGEAQRRKNLDRGK